MVDCLLAKIDEIKNNSNVPEEPISIIFDRKGHPHWTIELLAKCVNYETQYRRILVSLSFIKSNKSWIRIKFFSREDIDFYLLAPYKSLNGIETIQFEDKNKYEFMNKELNKFFGNDKESIYNQVFIILDELYGKIKK